MSENNTPKNLFYKNGIKLLVNKFFSEVSNSKSEVSLMHEGIERTFEVWAKTCIRDSKMKEDVWKMILQQMVKKNG